jgi:DNA-binding transcriptional regulator YiaG
LEQEFLVCSFRGNKSLENTINYYHNSNISNFIELNNAMISLTTTSEAQEAIAHNLQEQRINMGLTQIGLAKRSGVSVATLRKFEQKGQISMESYLKLLIALGDLDKFLKATKPEQKSFNSIDDVLADKEQIKRKRGWRT